MPGLRVRDATPADAEAIARVHVSTWQGAYAQVFPEEGLRALDERLEARTAWWTETIEAGAPRAHTLIAAADGVVVGFVDVRPSRDDDADGERVAELTAIYVAPESWGTGAGRALMAEALERLRASDFDAATLWVLDDNPRARRFYEAAGWSLDGCIKDDQVLGTAVREVRYRIALR
jgi:ribosomal protein S18 acetylase RimI-like enzyme